MPLKRCTSDGVQGWKWGDEGKCYIGEGAREKALRQGRAVEANKVQASLPNHDFLLYGQETMPWSCADSDECLYVKEAIYEGDFLLPGDVPLSVDKPLIDHWVDVTGRMLDNGVKIPLPLGHTTDPEKGRGEIVGAYPGVNKEGKQALFFRTKFNSKEAAEANKHTQVSIFSPPSFTDGKGNTYTRPITHVALTDYPVIPSLQGFESIAASFVPESEEIPMPLKELAARLNIECENDEQLADTIVASFEGLQAQIDGNATTLEEKDAEITALKAKVPSDPITVAASHLTMLRDNRNMKLSALVGEKISPAVKDGLMDLFASDQQLTLSLSSEAGDGGLFDKLVEVLRKNEVVKLGEGGEVISLAKEGADGNEENPLLADANKRREEAEKRTGK